MYLIIRKKQIALRRTFSRVSRLLSLNRSSVYIIVICSVVRGLQAVDIPTTNEEAATNSASSVTSPYDCINNVCVRKCCPEGQLLSIYYVCENKKTDEKTFQADFRHKDGRKSKVLKTLLITGFPTKPNCSLFGPPELEIPLLLEDGTLYTEYDEIKIRSTDEYCVDRVRELTTPC